MKSINLLFLLVIIKLWDLTRSDHIETIDMITEFIKSYDSPLTVTAILCWSTRSKIMLTNRLANIKKPTAIRFSDETFSSESYPEKVVLITDLNCPRSHKILTHASKKNMFRHPYRWLIQTRTNNSGNEVVPAELTYQNISIDSEVVIAQKLIEGAVTLKSIYKSYPLDDWQIESFGIWNVTHGLKKDDSMFICSSLRRKNLRYHRIPIAFNLNDKEKGIEENLTDYKILRSKHTVTTWGLYQTKALYQFMNATRQNVYSEDWGYFINGSWNGLVGSLVRGEAELTGTPIFMAKNRIGLVNYMTNPVQTWVKFIFREPPLSYQHNLFILPFTSSVWLALAGFVLMLIIILYLNALWEIRKLDIDNKQGLNLSDVTMIVVGAITQQGTFVELKGSVGRVVTVLLFFVFLFLFTAYAANIVALLQSSSKDIRTLADLLNSRMELGVQNTSYNYHYFTTATDPVRKAIYETKIAPRGSKPNFMSIEEGVKRLQKYPFAFNMDTGTGYRTVEKLFYEHEKCGLQEIPYLPQSQPWFIARKDSPYTEIFKIGLYRLREHGVTSRINTLVFAKKPLCIVSGGNFDSVSIIDAYPPLLLLIYGMIFAFVLLFVEILVHRRFIKSLKLNRDDVTVPAHLNNLNSF